MSEILAPLSRDELETLDDTDLDALGPDAQRTLLSRVLATYPLLLKEEPSDSGSDEYLLWEEELEMLDDFIDELTERLDG